MCCTFIDFNPRSPGGERPDSCACPWPSRYFNPRSPGGERLAARQHVPAGARHFNPRSPGGERPRTRPATCWTRYFNPRSPGGERLHVRILACLLPDFNPRSPGGERLELWSWSGRHGRISIHAPRVGSDRENGHLRPRYGQNHPFSTLIVSQIVVDVLGTVRKSQKHQRTSHYEVIKQPERRK